YNPFPANGIELASLSYVPQSGLQNGGNRPYLGVQVLNATDRAYIKMVQRGSPAGEAGLAVDDQIVSVSGTSLDDTQNTLAALIGQHSGGEQVELGVIRVGETGVTPITVTLATMLPPVIVTPSAEITVSDNTEFVIDIGFNGVTGVLVLADTAHVREPVTGSEVDVPAGSVVIVVPGYEIGAPIPVSGNDVNAWWNGEQQPTPVPPEPGPSPVPLDSTWLFIILAGCCCVIVMVVVVVIVLVTRKKKQPLTPTYYPPQR
ncbi:MAG: PDZ domain-containing protein, partial [Kiritimatiellota bacterium]|nr:PDZ domain-containing protein [Kiritimatiellota bacterium]